MKIGFYSYMRQLATCYKEVLETGSGFKNKFDNKEITTEEYLAEMTGKIYEISVRNSKGDEELQKDLDSDFADTAVKYLRERVTAYIQSQNELESNNTNKDSTNAQEKK
jgi:REP element-mobilizing transposase RayT